MQETPYVFTDKIIFYVFMHLKKYNGHKLWIMNLACFCQKDPMGGRCPIEY